MIRYKFIDSTRQWVHKIDPDGKSRESCSITILPPDALIEGEDTPVVSQAELDLLSARQNPGIKQLRNMTPEQAAQWVDTSITNLAQAKEFLKIIAVAMVILTRRF